MAEEVTTTNTDIPTATQLVARYGVSGEAIAELRARFQGVTFDTPANYEVGRKAIGTLRDLRGKVEKRRKELKADSLEYGRRVDAAAKELTKLISDIEDPLQAAKDAVDEAEAKRKRDEERAELIKLEEELRVKREADEAEAKKKRAEEEARLAEERRRLAEEEAKLAERRRQEEAAAQAERDRLAAQRREQEARERELREREAAARLEQEQREAAERARREAAEAEERARAEEARLAALAPDVEKVRVYAGRIRALAEAAPALAEPCADAIEWAQGRLRKLADQIEAFKP